MISTENLKHMEEATQWSIENNYKLVRKLIGLRIICKDEEKKIFDNIIKRHLKYAFQGIIDYFNNHEKKYYLPTVAERYINELNEEDFDFIECIDAANFIENNFIKLSYWERVALKQRIKRGE